MSHHHKICPRINSCLKRKQLTRPQLFQASVCVGKALMGILCRGSMSWKMFQSRTDAVFSKSSHLCRHHIGYQLRFAAERSSADHRVGWIGQHIRHRRKIQVKPILMKISSQSHSHLIGLIRIPGTPHIRHISHVRHRKSRIAGDPGHASSFLIHCEEGIHPKDLLTKPAEFLIHVRQLFF